MYPRHLVSYIIIIVLLVIYGIVTSGCSQHVKVFECKLQCDEDTILECKTGVSGSELELP